ncbi:uncharacterized protein Dsimw501_GD28921 [Drosophila simulans]|uniref:Cytochrome P450 307a1 n=1 Tax=Drosophila simulans TaxID=7240 RepID=A0A0J9R5X4_DROSI|nr:uncharacterized protein Dsimw501_GD28921 [Drosophila simulans]
MMPKDSICLISIAMNYRTVFRRVTRSCDGTPVRRATTALTPHGGPESTATEPSRLRASASSGLSYIASRSKVLVKRPTTCGPVTSCFYDVCTVVLILHNTNSTTNVYSLFLTALALCDWSQLQQKRRNLARRHCSPRESSSYFSKMSEIGGLEVNQLLDQLTNISSGYPCDVKPLILAASANMFCQYMCSVRFNYSDKGFQQIVEYFDEIFWEINQGYSFDYIPWLLPFYCNHISKIVHWSTSIRKFILERIVNHRESNININEPDKDFTDALLKSLKEDKNVSRNTIIFMLEDFIGGHSAVGNLVMLALAYIAKNPAIAVHIRNEVDAVSTKGIRRICLYDMNAMPYTMASILEVLRYSSSPIVPHVAMEDTVIKGFGVRKGTIVFINNYVLNMSESFWNHPELFDPERFLENNFTNNKENGLKCDDNRRTLDGSDYRIEFNRKNDKNGSTKSKKNYSQNLNNKQLKKSIPQFLPFSVGKRTCIGQSLVRGFGFLLLANIIQNYNVNSADFSKIKLEKSSVALPKKCFRLSLRPRT